MSDTLDPVAAIKAAIPGRRPISWEHRVAPEHAETLRQIKAAYRAGEFGTKQKPAAVAISEFLNREGIATVGFQGVKEWLAKE